MFRIYRRTLQALPALALSAAILPSAAGAQAVPSYARHEESIAGTIASIPDKWTLQVHDRRGYMDTVRLHQGTIINPTGIRLEPGFRVTIMGHADGSAFAASEIDTPYHLSYPYYGYPYYGYYPYGYYPYGPVFVPHLWMGFGWPYR
jgi:hypothetical protein